MLVIAEKNWKLVAFMSLLRANKVSSVGERWGGWVQAPADPGPVTMFLHHFSEGVQPQVADVSRSGGVSWL